MSRVVTLRNAQLAGANSYPAIALLWNASRHDERNRLLTSVILFPMKNLRPFLTFLFLARLVAAQRPASPQNPCEEKPISQRQMDDCAAFEYKQADAHLNKVYGKAVQYMADDLVRAQKKNDQRQIKCKRSVVAVSTLF